MIITGSSADGSDAMMTKGMYTSPCGNFWSNMPYTREQKAYDKVYDHCVKYRKTFAKLYLQIKSGSKENLPKWVRVWFITEYDLQETFVDVTITESKIEIN